MSGFLELLGDNTSVVGRLVTTAVLLVVALVVAAAAGWLVGRRADDPYTRYYLRKAVRAVVVVVLLIALALVWQPFAGRIAVVLGLATAGLAFAMQEVIGALAGWVSILTGQHFRVGDRIQMGGVRGDVLDLSPLRTKVLEIGSRQEDDSWIRGRQYTGRVVSISNKAIFSEPVYNSSAALGYLWEELTIPVPYDDWGRAEVILREEAERASSSADASRPLSRCVGAIRPVGPRSSRVCSSAPLTTGWN